MSTKIVNNMDPIANLLTSIRNGYLARKDNVEVPYSKMKESLLQLFAQKGFILSYEKTTTDGKTNLIISLHYLKSGSPVLTGIKKISKPGVRLYTGVDKIPPMAGAGFSVLSTSKGLLTDEQARAQNIGGEIICQVW